MAARQQPGRGCAGRRGPRRTPCPSSGRHGRAAPSGRATPGSRANALGQRHDERTEVGQDEGARASRAAAQCRGHTPTPGPRPRRSRTRDEGGEGGGAYRGTGSSERTQRRRFRATRTMGREERNVVGKRMNRGRPRGLQTGPTRGGGGCLTASRICRVSAPCPRAGGWAAVVSAHHAKMNK
jgi:hypothetical protein